MTIFHLATAADWAEAQAVGEYRTSTRGAALDEVGFIHASFADQVATSAARWFADVDEALVLLEIDPRRTGAEVRVEAGFPHLYGALPTSAVVAVRPARMVDGALVV